MEYLLSKCRVIALKYKKKKFGKQEELRERKKAP